MAGKLFISIFKIKSLYKHFSFSFLLRHDRPSDPDDPLSDQNIRDRYYGVNDPVASKIMKRASALPTLEAPEDPHITTLYIGGQFIERKGFPR